MAEKFWESDEVAGSGIPDWERDPVVNGGLSDAAQAFRFEGARDRGNPPDFIEQAFGGAQHAMDRAAYGVKDWFTDLTPEEKAQLERGDAFVDETGKASSVGEFAGDIATTGGAMGITSAATRRMLPAAMSLWKQRATRAATSSAAGGGTGATVEPEDKVTGAVVGTIGGPIGEFLPGALRAIGSKFAKPVPSTRAADALIDREVIPTVGQGADTSTRVGRQARRFEDQAATLPVVGSGVRDRQSRAGVDLLVAAQEASSRPTLGIADRKAIREAAVDYFKGKTDIPAALKESLSGLDNADVDTLIEIGQILNRSKLTVSDKVDAYLSMLAGFGGGTLLGGGHLPLAAAPAAIGVAGTFKPVAKRLLGGGDLQRRMAAYLREAGGPPSPYMPPAAIPPSVERSMNDQEPLIFPRR